MEPRPSLLLIQQQTTLVRVQEALQGLQHSTEAVSINLEC